MQQQFIILATPHSAIKDAMAVITRTEVKLLHTDSCEKVHTSASQSSTATHDFLSNDFRASIFLHLMFHRGRITSLVCCYRSRPLKLQLYSSKINNIRGMKQSEHELLCTKRLNNNSNRLSPHRFVSTNPHCKYTLLLTDFLTKALIPLLDS